MKIAETWLSNLDPEDGFSPEVSAALKGVAGHMITDRFKGLASLYRLPYGSCTQIFIGQEWRPK